VIPPHVGTGSIPLHGEEEGRNVTEEERLPGCPNRNDAIEDLKNFVLNIVQVTGAKTGGRSDGSADGSGDKPQWPHFKRDRFRLGAVETCYLFAVTFYWADTWPSSRHPVHPTGPCGFWTNAKAGFPDSRLFGQVAEDLRSQSPLQSWRDLVGLPVTLKRSSIASRGLSCLTSRSLSPVILFDKSFPVIVTSHFEWR
jgi:hypothetical protein